MSYGNPSDEVAEDYRHALMALEMNSRYEISNLTVIAKENTEHALAISEAVKTHIKQASPQKKLPAFYVLDSVVKNVGTPYTLFFGRQLYSTFMEAYALVDNSTRRKMDEMLKTWKEAVPGSMDTRPVFPPEITRPIENALIKARTSALQQEQLKIQQQGFGRGRPNTVSSPYRNTPTPPGVGRSPAHIPPGYNSSYNQPQHPAPGVGQQAFSPGANENYHPPDALIYSSVHNQQYPSAGPPYPPNGQQYPSNNQPYTPSNQQYPLSSQQYPPLNNQSYPPNNVQHYPPADVQQYANHPNGHQSHELPQRPLSQQYSQQPPGVQSWQAPSQGHSIHENSVGTLNRDISNLIIASKADFAQNPWDGSIQTRLKALLDLQTILSSQQLPPDQIGLIKNQVAHLSEAAQSSTPKVAPPQLVSVSIPAPASQPPTQQPSLSSLLGPGALAALIARQSATPQPTPTSQPAVSIRSPPPPAQPPYNPPATQLTLTSVPDPSSLLEKLRAAGILQGAPSPGTTNPLPATLSSKLPPGFPPSFSSTPPNTSMTPLTKIPNDVVLRPASLKVPRPHLISSLYEKLGAPCNQCGRRFHADEEGKKKKAAHLDWHFQSAHRMSDAMMRGQHRSWYVDELDWIKSREIDPDQPACENADWSGSATSATASKPKAIYIPVPDDPELKNAPCPVCQEKFKAIWLDDEQDFVWMDARQFGEKIYHATCHEEAYGAKAQAQMKRDTPEPSVLGKRKAEDEHIALRSKIKTEFSS